MKFLRILVFCLFFSTVGMAAELQPAASATNEFGRDLYRKLATGNENLCLSPYSIESALAMTLAGAEGQTRSELARVLHLESNIDEIGNSFAALQKSLEELTASSGENLTQSKEPDGPNKPITLAIANRLFAQKDYDFREQFLTFVKTNYAAAMEPLDFAHNAAGATRQINDWVADQRRKKIHDLIPSGALDATTRMVLVNALYLKAPWAHPFEKEATSPESFHVRGGDAIDVPMMHRRDHNFGYAKEAGFVAVSLPYSGGDLNFVILLPDDTDGLATLEAKLTPKLLAQCAKLRPTDINLSLPKFTMEPPTIALKSQLQALGMKTAFDEPRGSANFDRLAARKPNEYLYLSKVFHKTFFAVDEKGAEAAAATAVVSALATNARPPGEPIEVKVDRPFLYAIQHVASGACLFIGRVTDPR